MGTLAAPVSTATGTERAARGGAGTKRSVRVGSRCHFVFAHLLPAPRPAPETQSLMSSAAGSSLPARPTQAGAAVTGGPAPGNPSPRAGAPVETRDASARRRRRSSGPEFGQAGRGVGVGACSRAVPHPHAHPALPAHPRVRSARGDQREKHHFSAQTPGRAWCV